MRETLAPGNRAEHRAWAGAHPAPQAVPLQYHEFSSVWRGVFYSFDNAKIGIWNLPCFHLRLQARTQSTVSNLLFLLASDLPDLQDKPHPVLSGTKPTFQINNAEIYEGQLNTEEKLWFCLTYHCGLSLPISRRFPMLQQHGQGHHLFICENVF